MPRASTTRSPPPTWWWRATTFAISERFEIPVETLKAHNKLHSHEVKPGQKLNLGMVAPHKSPAHQAAAKKPISKMTCEDFLGLEEDFQPKAVYWAVA